MRFGVDEFFDDAGVLRCTPRRQMNWGRFKDRKFNAKGHKKTQVRVYLVPGSLNYYKTKG